MADYSNFSYYPDPKEMEERRRTMAGVLAVLALGVGVGAAIALMFAPQSGDKLRKEVGSSLQDGFKRGLSAAQDALGALEDEFPGLRERAKKALKDVNVKI